MSEITELERVIAECKVAQDALAIERDAINKQARVVDGTREIAQNKLDTLLIEGDGIPLDVLINMFPDTKIRADEWKRICGEYGLETGGYWPTTYERAVKIQMHEGDVANIDKMAEGLEKLIPLYTPLKNGLVMVDIFEHTLSQYGSITMAVNQATGVCNISNGSGIISGTYKEALLYINKHHWYTTDKEYDEEDY